MKRIESAPPDIASSSDSYANRFSGPAGQWLLSRQTAILLALTQDLRGARVLDVGGGHAQIAPPLAERGHAVSVLVSTPEAGRRLEREFPDTSEILVGDLSRLPVEDRAFEMVTSFRIMAHIPDWRGFVAELCRASGDAVIIDFPTATGVSVLAPALFWAKKLIEKDTRRFHSIAMAELRAAFEENGFRVDRQVGQFVLPMALHRALKRPRVSSFLEALLSPLAARFGNPVILRARRLTRDANPDG